MIIQKTLKFQDIENDTGQDINIESSFFHLVRHSRRFVRD